MNLRHDDDKLNFVIHQPDVYGETVQPLTVRAIVDHITTRQRAAPPLSDAERGFLADFAVAEDPGLFIEDSFLQTAIEGGKTQREKSYRLGGERDEEGGWFGLHRFLGLYVINSTQYGEGQDLYGPYAKKKEAKAIFYAVAALNTP
jgi:hypothetical protein